jgi:thiol-disulfide isomerase/thioredoxin
MDADAGTVAVGEPIGRPRVVTLWGSWCPPCGKELPAFVAFSRRAGDRVQVVGVDTADDAVNAVAAARDLGVAFPNVYDRRSKVQRALGVVALPATAFLDRDGRLVHLHTGTPLDEAMLTRLAEKHLGVVL